MNKNKTIKMLNERIDKLIIQGKLGKEYKRLIKLHYLITH